MRWFRFYNDVVDDPKVQRLSGNQFKAWVNLLCLASANGGKLPPIADIAFKLRKTAPEIGRLLAEFQSLGLFDPIDATLEPHNWSSRQYKSDQDLTAPERSRRYREKHAASRVTNGPSHAPQRQNTDTDTEKKIKEESAPRVRATRLAHDWAPSESDFLFARQKGLTVGDVETEAIKFRNYWTAKSGKDATKMDWSRTWQNWILRSAENEQRRISTHFVRPSAKPNVVDVARRYAEYFESQVSSDCESGPVDFLRLPKL